MDRAQPRKALAARLPHRRRAKVACLSRLYPATGLREARAAREEAKRRALERGIDDILETPTTCAVARVLLAKIARARDQLLTFCDFPGEVEPTNNGCERAPRPAVIQRKVTKGLRAKSAADHDAALRTTLDAARLAGGQPFGIILQTTTF